MEEKKKEWDTPIKADMTEEVIRQREELSMQYRALKEIKEMALKYGYDISKPATNSKEAVQWLYFGYLGAIKDQNGAAMSIGRTSTFLDIYFERDLADRNSNRRTSPRNNGPLCNEIKISKIFKNTRI